MPTPAIGETWELRDQHGRSTRGIVAEITDTRVTLVSLTGARTHSPVGRFQEQWGLVAAPPRTTLRCRCGEPGILTYQRGTSPDFVCPKHLPVGILATLHTSGEVVGSQAHPINVVLCPDCGSTDSVEDARLGVLGRGEFGWWTCTRCSSRWGFISAPNHSDDLDSWYEDILNELTQEMIAENEIQRIECSLVAWRYLGRKMTDPSARRTQWGGIEIEQSPTLTPGTIMIHTGRAPAGSTVARRPIQKIGGIGNRSARSGFEPVIAPAPGYVAPTRLPTKGHRYYQRVVGREVEVVRVEESEGQWYVAVQTSSHTSIGSPPTIMDINDFNRDFVPSGKPNTVVAPAPMPPTVKLEAGDEWFDYDHDEYVKIVTTDMTRLTAVVSGGSTGRTRNVPMRDFENVQKYKRIVRLTAHQRLMADDD